MSTVVEHFRSAIAENFMPNCNVGEMFLIFMLELKLRPFVGVDFTCLFPEEVSAENEFIRGCWERILMGFFPSPYLVTKDLMEVEMMIRGNRRDLGNTFGWKKVVLNLPCTPTYDPSIPWVYKVGFNDKVASDIYFYIDNVRPMSGSENLVGKLLSGFIICLVSWDFKILVGRGLPRVRNLGSGWEPRWI